METVRDLKTNISSVDHRHTHGNWVCNMKVSWQFIIVSKKQTHRCGNTLWMQGNSKRLLQSLYHDHNEVPPRCC